MTISEQIRALTPEQKDAALLILALRAHGDDWQQALDLATQLHTPEQVAS